MLAAPWFQAVIGFLVSVLVSVVMLSKTMKELPKPQPPPPPTVAENAKPSAPVWSFRTEAVQELVAELTESKEGLLAEHKDLATLQAQISAEKQEVEKIKQEVQRLREELDRRVVEVSEYEAKNLKTLAQTYSAMAPNAAAVILRELDEDTVVKIFSLMKVEKVGVLLGELAKTVAGEKSGEESPAKRAARISDKLRLMKTLKKEVSQ